MILSNNNNRKHFTRWGSGIVRFHTECSRASGTNAGRRARGPSPSRRLALHHRTKLYTAQATIMLLKAPQSLSCPYFPPSPPHPPRTPHRPTASLPHPAFYIHLNPNVCSLLHVFFARKTWQWSHNSNEFHKVKLWAHILSSIVKKVLQLDI